MDATYEALTSVREQRMREAEHERVAGEARRAGRDYRRRTLRDAAGRTLIHAGLRLIGPATP